MADKIVQLMDKTKTDNWFPIAGGMAADSITTAMVQDKAVTYDKMDYSTMMPAYAAKTWNRGSIASDQGDAAIAGDYTGDTDLITIKITPRKTGVVKIFTNVPVLGTGGTAFVDIYIDGSQVRRMAAPSANTVAVFSVIGGYIGELSVGVEHTIKVRLAKNNTSKMTVYGYSPIELSAIELG